MPCRKGAILAESDHVLILPKYKLAYARKNKSYTVCEKEIAS